MAGFIGARASVVSSGAERKQTYAITTTTTSLTGLAYTPTKVHVYHNGIRLVDGTDYTATDGSSITLTTAAENGDEVVVISYATFQTSDTVSAANGGTFAGNVDFTGSFTSLGIDDNATSTAMTLDSSGNVGIGTATPSNTLDVIGAVDTNVASFTTLGDGGGPSNRGLSIATDSYGGSIRTVGSSVSLGFDVNGSERCRIDASGNLLINKTTANASAVGIELHEDGELYLTRDSDRCAMFRRLNTQGYFVQFNQGTTRTGTLGNDSGDFVIDGGSGHTGLRFGAIAVNPRDNGADSDNQNDLGGASTRWDDVYATNGTIQTSDRNEKQDIAELDEAEKRVATAAKGLIRKYRWIDAVQEKGDDARIHVGIIAQDLQAAFEAEGLDASRYAMFISTTWWEADETYTDDDGVEQTRTNTYETQEEAPEGATERTRLGVRYPELLAFIIGAL